MTEALSLERFRDLADAYGGAIARWPADVRAPAMAMATDPAVRAILAEAEALDATLDAWKVAVPSMALRERVLLSRGSLPLPRRARIWWSGIGIAAALSGAVAGSVAVAAVTPTDSASENATAFGDLGGQEG